MKITRDEVLHVAGLARLTLADSDIDRFAGQLGGILSYVESLSQVNTADIPPTSHAVETKNAFRPDVLHNHLEPEKALSNAPESEDGCFVVPKIIE